MSASWMNGSSRLSRCSSVITFLPLHQLRKPRNPKRDAAGLVLRHPIIGNAARAILAIHVGDADAVRIRDLPAARSLNNAPRRRKPARMGHQPASSMKAAPAPANAAPAAIADKARAARNGGFFPGAS